MTIRTLTRFLASSALSASVAAAPGPAAPDVASLCQQAAVIAVGRVSRVREGGQVTLRSPLFGEPLPAHKFLGRLDVESVLKGDVGAPSVEFRFVLPDAPAGYRGIGPGEFGVFFFKKSNGALEVLDPHYPSLVAAPGLASPPGSLVEQVVAEVAHVLAYLGSTRDMRMEAVMTLQSVRTPAATAALKEAAGGSDVRSRVLALAALLRRGDISVLPAVKEMALSSPEATDNDLMPGIGAALRYVHDAKAIPILKDLLQAPNVWVRRGAAAALRNTHSPKAIPPLSKALYGTDREVRYYAVVGLGQITGQNQWTPSIANFNKNEKKFLNHWRKWAKQLRPPVGPRADEGPPPASGPTRKHR
jgi:hypothetical protein